MSKPLWQQFYEMTPEQQEAEKAEDLRRMRSGDMSQAEALERYDAWGRCRDALSLEMEEFEEFHRQQLARGR